MRKTCGNCAHFWKAENHHPNPGGLCERWDAWTNTGHAKCNEWKGISYNREQEKKNIQDILDREVEE
jgi:hypothetical protein